MKLKTNPLLEDHGPVYKFFYYAGPVMLIAAFLLLWNSVSAVGKVNDFCFAERITFRL